MAQIHIEHYRNFQIVFDTEREEFISISDYYDNQQVKKSFAATKKAIDEYIKANQDFKPFFVVKYEYYTGAISPEGEKIKIVSIRKDGRFVTEHGAQIGDYDMRNFAVYNPDMERAFEEMSPLVEELKQINDMREKLQEKIQEAGRSVPFQPLTAYAKTIQQ